MHKLNIVGAALVAGALIAGCDKQATATDNEVDNSEVLIEVNGKKLTSAALDADVEKYIAAQVAQAEALPAEELEFERQNLRNQLAQSFLVESALVDRAKAEGFVVTDDDRKAHEETLLKSIARMPNAPKTFAEFIEVFPLGKERALEKFDDLILINKMLKAANEKLDVAGFAAEAQKQIDDILAHNAQCPASEEAALAKVQQLKLELSQPGTDIPAKFAELARENSDCPSSRKGGDLDYFKRGDMVPEFDKVAFEQPVGEVSEPVKTRYGYHLILVTERTPAKEATDESPAEPERARASHILVKTLEPQPVPTIDQLVSFLKRRAEMENVDKVVLETVRAASKSVAPKFKDFLPPEENVETPVETSAEK